MITIDMGKSHFGIIGCLLCIIGTYKTLSHLIERWEDGMWILEYTLHHYSHTHIYSYIYIYMYFVSPSSPVPHSINQYPYQSMNNERMMVDLGHKE